MNQADLDQLLAGMAEDVPPMPADFHDKWMDSVRAEAKQAEPPAAAPVSQWPKILSVAAVFVFLIGGTLVYRSARKTILPQPVPDSAVSMTATARPAENAAASGPDTGTAAMEEPAMVYDAMEEPVMEEPAMEEAVMEESEENGTAGSAGESVFSAPGPAGEAGSAALDSAPEAPSVAITGKTEKTAGESAARKSAEEAGEPAAAVYAAGGPEAEEADQAAENVAEETAAELPDNTPTAETPSERQGIGGFLEDMGAFLLAVWPYLLILAVPFATALCRKKFNKKQ